jgi:hypothetical protein
MIVLSDCSPIISKIAVFHVNKDIPTVSELMLVLLMMQDGGFLT